MKILLIVPQIPKVGIKMMESTDSLMNSTIPVEYLHLMALSPSDVEVSVFDAGSNDPVDASLADLIYMSSYTFQISAAYELADRFRELNTKVVIGGSHATALPDEVLLHVDSVIVGEAESVWGQLVMDVKAGVLNKVYKSNDFTDIDSISTSIAELLANNNCSLPRRFRFPTLISKSIINSAAYNNYQELHGSASNEKSIPNLLREIELSGFQHVFLKDQNVLNNASSLYTCIQGLKELGVSWRGDIILSEESVDIDLVHAICYSNCKELTVKFTGNETSFKDIINKHEGLIRKLQDNSVSLWFNFIVGFDDDRNDVYDNIYDVVESYGLRKTTVTLLTPLPGSKLYKIFDNSGRIIDKNWSNYNYINCVFKPKHQSPEQLEEKYIALVKALNRLLFRRAVIALNS